jgi:glycosyltransferase involved in cell wall biosynthesis
MTPASDAPSRRLTSQSAPTALSSSRLIDTHGTATRLRVGIIAPPWVAIPPPGYGGIELAIDVLARGLRQRGHDVILFTTGDSTTPVERHYIYDTARTDTIGSIPVELCHVDAAYHALGSCDIVHDHTLSGLLLGPHHQIPVVTTNHGPFVAPLTDLYRRTVRNVPLIAISGDQARRAPTDIPVSTVIHHSLDLDAYPYDPAGGDYLVTIGRMNPCKGIDHAIAAARAARVPLIIAAKNREPAENHYYNTVIKPLLGPGISYIGEIGHDTKIELLGGARALLNPIQWAEPFGLVMIEALACGTPVIATPNGAAPELIDHGTTGYLTTTPSDLDKAIRSIDRIDRARCRQHAEHRFAMARMAHHHEDLYLTVLQHHQASQQPQGTGTSGRRR